MAISTVGETTKIVNGTAANLTSITVDLPAGIQLNDVMHIAVYHARTKFFAWEIDPTLPEPPTHHWKNKNPNKIATQWDSRWDTNVPGWNVAGVYRSSFEEFPYEMMLLRRIATGGEGSSVTINVTHNSVTVFQNAPPAFDPSNQNILVAGVAIAHRDVDLQRVYASPPLPVGPGTSGNLDSMYSSFDTNTPNNSALVQLRFERALTRNGQLQENDQIPLLPNPFQLDSPTQPPEWDVQGESRTPAITTVDHYSWDGTVAAQQILTINAAALDTNTYTPGRARIGAPPQVPGTQLKSRGWVQGESLDAYAWAFALMDPTVSGLSVDEAPPSGIPGLTGSGWVVPEWVGRTQQIVNPLLCGVWVEDPSGPYGPELQPVPEESMQPIALDANFNALGACTTATAVFPADPGFVPWQHVLKFSLVQPEDDYDGVVWWTGVVRNVSVDNGLHRVTLDGLWVLLNDGRVQLDQNDVISRPVHGVIMDTIMFGGGDPFAVDIVNAADRQQSWSEYLNKTFRTNPDAAWGIGPDQAFTMGIPRYAGYFELAVEHPAIVEVVGGEFILPPYVTEWWAEDSAGVIKSGQLVFPHGLLTPDRLAKSRLSDLNDLIAPPEASLPTYAGPSYTITVAGVAVPPLMIVNLPVGDQMVASASVSVTLGEEGAMPRVTTTLTTVALPYERS